MGAWFSANVRQRYRTRTYRLLRQPIVSALLLIPFHALFYVIISLFTQWGVDVNAHPTARLDFALSNTWIVILSFGCEMLIAGLIAQLVARFFRDYGEASRPCSLLPANEAWSISFYVCGRHIHFSFAVDFVDR